MTLNTAKKAESKPPASVKDAWAFFETVLNESPENPDAVDPLTRLLAQKAFYAGAASVAMMIDASPDGSGLAKRLAAEALCSAIPGAITPRS